MTALEIAAGAGALVALWVVLLMGSWLEELLGPSDDVGQVHEAPSGPPAAPMRASAASIAAPRATDAA